MTTIKERFDKWKSRKFHQKLGDVFFWLLLVTLIIPGPRKVVSTALNSVMLHLKRPSISNDKNVYQLTEKDFNWDIKTSEGELIDPASLKGEVIFLNFWGTFCPPCIAEMPEIQKIYNAYNDRVKFILVAAESPEKVNNFLKSKGYTLPSYFGGRNMPAALTSPSIPTTYIISRDGRIVTKKVGAADWDSKATRKIFDELLAK